MLPVFDPLLQGAIALDVLAASRASPEDIAARQRERLVQLLQSAGQHSPWYRKQLRGADPAQVALADLPVASKTALMAHFDEWVTDPALDLAALRAFTADPARIGEPFLGRYTVWESSGTRGEPGLFVQDAQAMAVYDALEALRRDTPRPWQRVLDPMLLSERIAFVGATSGHFASQVTVQRLRRLNPWMAHAMRSFSILQPTAQLVGQLNDFAPTIVSTYPTAAAMLADEAAQGRLRTRPAEVWTGGETLGAAMRERIVHGFGCALRNSYGASEFLAVAWECGQGQLHVNSDWVILEPVDRRHRPVHADAPSHTTLLTNLANQVQPVIRCDIGDEIRLPGVPCACGSPLPVIEVQGRRDEPLTMAGKGGRGVTLLPLALTTVLEDDAGVFDFQLCRRDARTLVLRLGACAAAADAAAHRCRAALLAFGAQQGVAGLRVEVQIGRTLTLGRSGKLQRVLATEPDAG